MWAVGCGLCSGLNPGSALGTICAASEGAWVWGCKASAFPLHPCPAVRSLTSQVSFPEPTRTRNAPSWGKSQM